MAVPDEVMGQEVKAVVVPEAGFTPEDLPAFLASELPKFAWPRYVEVRTELPKTPTQKVQKAGLASPAGPVVDLRPAQARETA